ncbi:ACT domain-containing protein ACR4-like isoform X2 [Carex rostrata]|jgi:UTP:GlnB (protein PII) uridylyltransferase
MGVLCTYDSDSDDDYETFVEKMNPPRVVVDNESCPNATVIEVGSKANKNGILLEVVQVLTDLNLVVTKGYITQEGGWFMDVFSVTDKDGNKLKDQTTIEKVEGHIRKSLGADSSYVPSKRRSVDVATSTDYTVIELTGNDRPGLLSEVSAVLYDLNCNLVKVEIWTHNTRAAAILHLTDQSTNSPVKDSDRLSMIKERLNYVLKGSNLSRGAKTDVSVGCAKNMERRLHKLMSDDGDFEIDSQDVAGGKTKRPSVTITNWNDKDYSVVTIRCKDRPKLLFDAVCTLTDMMYVIFHGNVAVEGSEAYQEFYIRHVDGSRVKDEDRERVIHWLKAAIERRVYEGLKLELSTPDIVGLLSEMTRIFREHSLTVTRAEISSGEGKAISTFYVRDNNGDIVMQKTIETIREKLDQIVKQKTIREKLDQSVLHVEGQIEQTSKCTKRSPINFLFGELFRAMSLNFGRPGL